MIENYIDIWTIKFSDHIGQLDNYLLLLSDEEKKRANKFYFNSDKQAYIISHGGLRKVLASYLNVIKPAKLEFSIGKQGKPFLTHYHLEFSFNLSHAKQYAMIAVVSNLNYLGIDIEENTRVDNFVSLAKRFFHPREVDYLVSRPEEQQKAVFFKFWTAKEAFVKAIGRGVSFGLDKFAVDLAGDCSSGGAGLANNSPTIALIENNCENNYLVKKELWQINYLNAPKDHTGCLAFFGNEKIVRYRDYFNEFDV